MSLAHFLVMHYLLEILGVTSKEIHVQTPLDSLKSQTLALQILLLLAEDYYSQASLYEERMLEPI